MFAWASSSTTHSSYNVRQNFLWSKLVLTAKRAETGGWVVDVGDTFMTFRYLTPSTRFILFTKISRLLSRFRFPKRGCWEVKKTTSLMPRKSSCHSLLRGEALRWSNEAWERILNLKRLTVHLIANGKILFRNWNGWCPGQGLLQFFLGNFGFKRAKNEFTNISNRPLAKD